MKLKNKEELTCISFLKGFKLKRRLHLSLRFALAFIVNNNPAIAFTVVDIVIAATTPFPITLPLRTTLPFHRLKPIKDRSFALSLSFFTKPRNRKNPQKKKTQKLGFGKRINLVYFLIFSLF